MYLEPSEILDLREIIELQIETVDADEAEYIEEVEDQPGHEHDDVVGEDHVIDDSGVDPGHDLPGGENTHHPKPA